MREGSVMRTIRWTFVIFWLVVALLVIRMYDSTSGTDVEREDTTVLVDELDRLGN